MTSIYFLIGFLILICYGAIEGYFFTKKYMKYSELSEKQRTKIYGSGMLSSWIVTVICIVMLLIFNISLKTIGLRGFIFDKSEVNIIFAIISYVISGLMLLSIVYQLLMYCISENYRIALVEKMKKAGEGVDIMLPRTKREKKWFVFVSLTAGISEG